MWGPASPLPFKLGREPSEQPRGASSWSWARGRAFRLRPASLPWEPRPRGPPAGLTCWGSVDKSDVSPATDRVPSFLPAPVLDIVYGFRALVAPPSHVSGEGWVITTSREKGVAEGGWRGSG